MFFALQIATIAVATSFNGWSLLEPKFESWIGQCHPLDFQEAPEKEEEEASFQRPLFQKEVLIYVSPFPRCITVCVGTSFDSDLHA